MTSWEERKLTLERANRLVWRRFRSNPTDVDPSVVSCLRQQDREISKGPVQLWLVDPPWPYNDRKKTRKDNPNKKPKFGIGVERRYSAGTMKMTELESLSHNIQRHSTNDAYLMMWVTKPLVNRGIQLLEDWGFNYVQTPFSWVKTTKRGKLFAGPGAYSLTNLEEIILGRRRTSKSIWHSNAKGCYKPHSVQMLPHPRGEDGKIIHSRKPVEFHQELEKWLFPFLRPGNVAVELFATEPREGWITLGHALTGSLIQDDLNRDSLLLPVAH